MTAFDRRTVVKGIGATALTLSGGQRLWAQGQPQGTPRRGGSINVALVQGNAKTCDPLVAIQPEERELIYLVFNSLVTIAPDFSIVPELATSWDVEDDGKRYILHLREDVKFQDGTPFNAEAVKYNIEKRLNPATNSPARLQIGPAIASVQVLAPYTVALNLNFAWAGLMATFADRAGFMVSPTAYEKLGPDFGRNPVGSGPFKLKQWTQGTSVIMERNPDYYLKDLPYLDAINFYWVANTAVAAQRLNIGEVDFLDRFGPTELAMIDTSKGTKTFRFPISRWWNLEWKVDKPPFDNRKLRIAIAHGIDRDKINQVILGGQGTVANGMSPEGLWWSSPAKPSFEYSPDKAKALLKESGYDLSQALTLSAPSDPQYNKIATLSAEMLQQIGLKISLAPVAQAEYFGRSVQGSINWCPEQWAQRADPDNFFSQLVHSKGQNNLAHYSNPEVDSRLEKARQLLDHDERRRLYGEVEQLVMADLPYIPIYWGAEYVAIGRRIGGYVVMPDQDPRFRYVWQNA